MLEDLQCLGGLNSASSASHDQPWSHSVYLHYDGDVGEGAVVEFGLSKLELSSSLLLLLSLILSPPISGLCRFQISCARFKHRQIKDFFT